MKASGAMKAAKEKQRASREGLEINRFITEDFVWREQDVD
jgi:hypothetical protein